MATLVEISVRLKGWEAISFNRRANVGFAVTELAELCQDEGEGTLAVFRTKPPHY
jgi:hypothetical protein